MAEELGTLALRFEREGSIAWCVIDRPHARNALTPGGSTPRRPSGSG
jgi:enoyl-CoA hydratase